MGNCGRWAASRHGRCIPDRLVWVRWCGTSSGARVCILEEEGVAGDVVGLTRGLPRSDGSGSPVGYERTAKGFRVWSLGPDRKEDNGRFSSRSGAAETPYNPNGWAGDILLRYPIDPQSERITPVTRT